MSDPTLDIIPGATGDAIVAAGGTITFQYPLGRARSSYMGDGGGNAVLGVRSSQALYNHDVDFNVVFGTSTILVTYNGLTPIPAQTPVFLQVSVRDTSGSPVSTLNPYVVPAEVFPAGL